MEILKIHINNFLEAVRSTSPNEIEAVIFADDAFGNHIGMVRCKYCLGYNVFDLSQDKQTELIESNKKMADAITKSIMSGEGWKNNE